MRSNHDQYMAEKQQKFLSYVNQLAESTPTSLIPRSQRQNSRSRVNQQDNWQGKETTQQTMIQPQVAKIRPTLELNPTNKEIQPVYTVQTLILDSNHRNTELYPTTSDFVLRIADTLKNVAMLRILKTEFYQPGNTLGYFILNDIKVPLQTNTIEHAYLYINGYAKAVIGNEQNNAILGRIGPGSEIYPAVSGSILQDPYAYIFQPIEPKLRRFHLRLLNHEGQYYQAENTRLILTIAVYCIA